MRYVGIFRAFALLRSVPLAPLFSRRNRIGKAIAYQVDAGAIRLDLLGELDDRRDAAGVRERWDFAGAPQANRLPAAFERL